MELSRFLDQMFPGDASRGFPVFSDLGLDEDHWLPSRVAAGVSVARSQVAPLPDDDVNDTLKALRRIDPEATQVFVDAALEAYFSAPEIGRTLRGGLETLFPNARALPDIDTDLLLPVLERYSEETDRD